MSQLPVKPSAWTEIHPGLGISLMDHLFNRMDGHYPNRWRAAFPSPASIANWKESWVESFIKHNITPADVKRGISACPDMYDWPPNSGEFIKACRPQIDHAAAFHEAQRNQERRDAGKPMAWTSKAIYWAFVAFGSFDLRNATWSRDSARWITTLDGMIADEREGSD